MANRTVSVALVADVGQYQSAMVRAASTTKAVGDNATVAGTRAQRGFDMAGRGGALLAGVLAGGVALGLKSTVDAAANAEQSLGGVQAVFKDYAGTVVASSKEADRALGLSANSYRELATIIGSQMKNAGVPMEELAEKTEGIIAIGADLAAQFGGSTQQAVEALSSAFRGELDPIERYGISLTAAAVGAKAVEMGLAESETELTANAKAMATLAIVTEQSADAQGAFSREADTASGRAQRAAAQWENLKVAVGDQLLPVWSALVDVLGTKVIPALGDVLSAGADVAGFLADLAGWVSDNTPLVAALGTVLAIQLAGGLTAVGAAASRMVLAPVVLGLSNMLGAVDSMPGAFARAGGAIAGFMSTAAPLAALIGVAYAVNEVISFSTANEDAAKSVDELRDSVRNLPKGDQIRTYREEIQRLQEQIDSVEGQNAFDKYVWKNPFGNEAKDVAVAREEIERLNGAIEAAKDTTPSWIEGLVIAAKGLIQGPGSLAEATKVQLEESEQELEDWMKSLQSIAEGFVEPLGAYKALLDEKTAKEREAATATAAATGDATDSWEDYATDVTVSLDELATRLEEQLLAHDNWAKNIGIITQRGGIEVGQILAAMGEEGVQIAAQMANGTDAEFDRMAGLLIEDARRGGAGAAAEMDTYMKIMAANAASGGRRSVQSLAAELGVGVDIVRGIAARYGISLADGINPILKALNKPLARPFVGNSGLNGMNTGGGYAEGGYTGPGGKYQPAGIVHAGEYVLTQEQVNSLGIDAIEAFANRGYATGGFVTPADVPRPRSTAPYGSPISTAGDATMQTGYDGTTELLRYLNAVSAANAAKAAAAAGPLGGGSVGGGWTSIWNHVKAAIPQARINSTFRAGDPGYHGRGKAIDFGFGSGPGGAGSAGLASINRYLHDTIGGNLAELIYDGIGDDRPDLKNGRPLTYSASTRAEHRNHVHAAVYHEGTNYVPRTGFAYLEQGEAVIPARLNPRGREFSGAGRSTGRSASSSDGPVSVVLQLDRDAVNDLLAGKVVETLGTRQAGQVVERTIMQLGRERS